VVPSEQSSNRKASRLSPQLTGIIAFFTVCAQPEKHFTEYVFSSEQQNQACGVFLTPKQEVSVLEILREQWKACKA